MRVLDDPVIRANIAERVAAWPRLTAEQRAQLAGLLRPVDVSSLDTSVRRAA